MKRTLEVRPGVLDELAREAGARSDKELSAFLGISEKQLENLRYGHASASTVVAFAAKAQTRRKAAELLDGAAVGKQAQIEREAS